VEERGTINGKVLVQLRSYSLSRYSSFYTNFRFYYVAMFSYITAMQPQNTICLRQTMVLIPNFSRPRYPFQKEFHRNVWSVFFFNSRPLEVSCEFHAGVGSQCRFSADV